MGLRQIHHGIDTKIFFDTDKKCIIKENANLKIENLKHYIEFQHTTNDVVKVLEIIYDTTFSMEFIPDVVSMVHPFLSFHRLEKIVDLEDRGCTGVITDASLNDRLIKQLQKKDLLELISTLNNVWTKGLDYSKNLPGKQMWTNGDFKLSNVAVINQDNRLFYKVLDPDSWEVMPGFSSVQTYYQSQFQLAFISQALINRIFNNAPE